MIRKYSSNYVFSPERGILPFGIVVVDDDVVINIIDTGGVMKEIAGLEFYSGFIVVGDIDSSSFDSLRAKKVSLNLFFKNVKILNKSIFHLDNLDFSNKRLKAGTIFKRIL